MLVGSSAAACLHLLANQVFSLPSNPITSCTLRYICNSANVSNLDLLGLLVLIFLAPAAFQSTSMHTSACKLILSYFALRVQQTNSTGRLNARGIIRNWMNGQAVSIHLSQLPPSGMSDSSVPATSLSHVPKSLSKVRRWSFDVISKS